MRNVCHETPLTMGLGNEFWSCDLSLEFELPVSRMPCSQGRRFK